MTNEKAIWALQHMSQEDPAFQEALVLALAALRAQQEAEKNDPLTLEELRVMDGEPVWVEIPKQRVAEWCIAKWDVLTGRTRLWCAGGGWFDSRNCRKSLFVYRRKPKECAE